MKYIWYPAQNSKTVYLLQKTNHQIQNFTLHSLMGNAIDLTQLSKFVNIILKKCTNTN